MYLTIPKRMHYIVTLCIFLLHPLNFTFATSPTLKDLLSAWKESIDCIHSANVFVDVRRTRADSSRILEMSGRLFFDEGLRSKSVTIKRSKAEMSGIWILTDQLLIEAIDSNPVVSVKLPTNERLSSMTSLDVKFIGLLRFGEVTELGIDQQQAMSIYDRLVRHGKSKITDSESFIIAEIEIEQDKSNIQYVKTIIKFDPKKAYSILASSTYVKMRGSSIYNHESSTEIQYENINGCWIPNLASVTSRSNDRIDIEMKWSDVNLPLTNGDFSIVNSSIPDGFIVDDLTHGHKKGVKPKLGDIRSGSQKLDVLRTQSTALSDDKTNYKKWIFILFLIVLLPVISIFFIRNRIHKISRGQNA